MNFLLQAFTVWDHPLCVKPEARKVAFLMQGLLKRTSGSFSSTPRSH
jgi:hypothetical protein